MQCAVVLGKWVPFLTHSEPVRPVVYCSETDPVSPGTNLGRQEFEDGLRIFVNIRLLFHYTVKKKLCLETVVVRAILLSRHLGREQS